MSSHDNSLAGKLCLVTGSTSGHGLGLALGLTRRGARVILHGRDAQRLEQARQEVAALGREQPLTWRCDLGSKAAVTAGARELAERFDHLDRLVNNAGLVTSRQVLTTDGWELTMAVNYLGPFQLTLRLLPLLRAAADPRIIIVSSDTHRVVYIDLNDVPMGRTRHGWLRAYGRSKLALVHFARELARRLDPEGMPVFAVDPGPVRSRIARNNPGLAPKLMPLLMRFFPPAEKAAETALWLCGPEAAAQTSGGYFRMLAERQPTLRGGPGVDRALWQISAGLTGVDLSPGR